MVRENHIKRMLKEGKNVIGTFIRVTDPAAAEVVCISGFDFIIIDNEHTAMNKESMASIIRTADVYNVVSVVRVGSLNAQEILQALDAGALGIQVPQIDNASEAQKVVDWAKYAPIGKRGYAASQRSAGYGTMDPVVYGETANRETLVICYCETKEGVENLDSILKNKEIDVVFIGPFDLSQAYGVLGRTNDPVVLDVIDTIIKKTCDAGKSAGIIASDAQQAQYWFDKGVQFVSLSSDLGMLAMVSKSFMKELGRSPLTRYTA